jgi:signal transduction histidine kinase
MKTSGSDPKAEKELSLSQKISVLDRFAASIAHELGNPLIGITYLLDDLSNRTGLSAEDKELIGAGLKECGRMRDLIDALLSDQYRTSPDAQHKLDINRIATVILGQYEKTCQTCQISIEMKLGGALPVICGIESQLSEALNHLVKNAVEAMQSGGTLVVESENRDNHVHLTVSDTGSGISPKHQERIFEPLFSTKEPARNKGLGLTVVHRVMQNHNGTVCFTTHPAQGSAFTLVLPARTPGE